MYIVYPNSYFFPVVREVNCNENEYRKILDESFRDDINMSEDNYEKILKEIDDDFINEST